MHYTDRPEWAAFLADIIAKPDDDLPRLVLCDWLEELGGEGARVRAEFIRVQIDLARARVWRVPHNGGTSTGPDLARVKRERVAELRNLERELWETASRSGIIFDWLSPVFGPKSDSVQPSRPAVIGDLRSESEATVLRGFVAEIRCSLADWCGGQCPECHRNPDYTHTACAVCRDTGRTPGIGPRVVRSHPVEWVVLTENDTSGVSYHDLTSGGVGWVWGVPLRWHGDDIATGLKQNPLYPWCWGSPVGVATKAEAEKACSDHFIRWAKSQPLTPVPLPA